MWFSHNMPPATLRIPKGNRKPGAATEADPGQSYLVSVSSLAIFSSMAALMYAVTERRQSDIGGDTMNENEKELIRIFREADDPTKAAEVMMDMLTRCVAGESIESIAESYGLVKTATGFVMACKE